MAPHLDPTTAAERKYAAEQAAAARDRAENEARIREQVECAPRRGCQRCGDPYAAINADGRCDLCEAEAWVPAAKAKLSPEELYPVNEQEEVE